METFPESVTGKVDRFELSTSGLNPTGAREYEIRPFPKLKA